MMRLRVSWTGPGVVGPSVTTFYGVGSPSTWRGAVLGWLQSLASNIPDDVQLTVPASGDEMNPTSGEIEGSWSAGTAAVVNGTNNNAFAIGVGLRFVWETADITRGRHVRGSTYIVPIAQQVFDTTGRLSPATQTTLLTAANTYLTDAQGTPVVWTRPKGFLPGAMRPITGVSLPENPTTLRSRRT